MASFKDFVADLSNVISVGEGHIVVCMSTESKDFTYEDIVGLLTDYSGRGETAETKEIVLFHNMDKIYKNGPVTIKDLTVNELTTDEKTREVRQYLRKGTKVYMGWFNADKEFKEIYSVYGMINDWSTDDTSGDYSKLTYVLKCEKNFLDATYTDGEEDEDLV